MEYKLKNAIDVDLISTVLNNRGITDIEKLLNPPKIEHDPNQLTNLKRGIEVFLKHVNSEKPKIGILADCDVDGYTSAAIMFRYLSTLGIRAKVFIHSGKIHGLADKDVLRTIKQCNLGLLIIPDASSGDFKEHKILNDMGTEILVLDHHDCKKYSSDAIVINNQMCDYPNKSLSGVGITYKFIAETDKQLNMDISRNMLDLVAIGNIADMMDVTSEETRYYIFQGLENINNLLIRKYLMKNDIDIATITEIAFKVAPELNSIIRMGDKESKAKLFNALAYVDYRVPYKPRGKKEEEFIHVTDDVVRLSSSLRSKQRNAVKKAIGEISEDIERMKDKNILIVKLNPKTPYTLTGLIANQLSKNNNKCCIVLRESEEHPNSFSGSARTYMDIDFKGICTKTQLFTTCEGHAGAFGVGCEEDKLEEIIDKLDKALEGTTSEKVYEVDYIIDAKDLRADDVQKISELKYLWGGSIPEPTFVIRDIIIPSNDIRNLARSTIGFSYRDINYIKTFASAKFIEDITCKSHVKFKPIDIQLDIVCKFVDSKYGPQVHIIDAKSKPYEGVLW